MRRFRDIPIKRKLMIITMSTSGAALLLACLAFVIYEMVVFRETMVHDLSITASMVGDNSSAAVTFGDRTSAEQTLKSLGADPRIEAAAVYSPDGTLFARYVRASTDEQVDLPPAEPSGYRFADHSLILFHRFKVAGEVAGTVYLRSDLEEMRARLRRYSVIVVLVMSVSGLLAYLLSRMLQRAISGPISLLAGVVVVVASGKDYSIRAVKQGHDELGQLIDGFNEMLGEIHNRDMALQAARDGLEQRVHERTQELEREIGERTKAEQALRAQERAAGMAEVATGVLHNVGNVLNSVNVSANLLAEYVQKSKAIELARAVAVLRAHEQDLGEFVTQHPQGKHLLAFLASLDAHLAAEREATGKELDSLHKNIEHIKKIVTMQQGYARIAGVREEIRVTDLVEDSLRLKGDELVKHGIEIVRDYADDPIVNIDKHKALQILVNIVSNAKNACLESNTTDMRVTLRVVSDGNRVRILVTDNGVGIAAENLTRIFSHGFTTRTTGHGFGLHGGALAARDLGGSLTVYSDGVGRGATFTLELPLPAAQSVSVPEATHA